MEMLQEIIKKVVELMLPIEKHGLKTSRIIMGCMGFGGGWNRDAIRPEHVREMHNALDAALESGIRYVDHADIYAMGKAEQVFGMVLKERPALREQLCIQSKVGIRLADALHVAPKRYDFSRDYILNSVDGILHRMGIENLDVLLLHRPDALMDSVEVGEAFERLKASGKVRFFGVSNMSAGQMRLLQQNCPERLIVNQLEMSLAKIGWLQTGVHVNQVAARDDVFPEGTLEYCQLEGIQIQAWGALAKGIFSKPLIDLVDQPENIRHTAKIVQELADGKGCSSEAIVLAWLMRHPANIQPVIGTTNPARIRACSQAMKVELSREEWYRLFVSSRGVDLP